MYFANLLSYIIYICPSGCLEGACLEIIPSVRVITPNGGEVFYIGIPMPYSVKINSDKVGSLSLYLTTATSVDDWKNGIGESHLVTSVTGFSTADNGDILSGEFTPDYNNFIDESSRTIWYLVAYWLSLDSTEGLYDFSDGAFTINPWTCGQG